jgi:hypothetical protein
MHTHFLFIFVFFIFSIFLGLGPAQPTWAGLGWTQPAQSQNKKGRVTGPNQ